MTAKSLSDLLCSKGLDVVKSFSDGRITALKAYSRSTAQVVASVWVDSGDLPQARKELAAEVERLGMNSGPAMARAAFKVLK